MLHFRSTRFFTCVKILLASALVAGCDLGFGDASIAPKIGVYYFPGWSQALGSGKGWDKIRPYPEREPLAGWYDDTNPAVIGNQIAQMAQAGINFVAFDWYWDGVSAVHEEAVNSYVDAKSTHDVQYELLWANHSASPTSLDEWDRMFKYLIKTHLGNQKYLKIDGKPVFTIFSGDVLRDQSKKLGISARDLLDRARLLAVQSGLRGIYFVLCAPATDYWVRDFAPSTGFDAITGYNYHFGLAGDPDRRTKPSHSYAELDSYYRMQWNWIEDNSKIPYFVPMTAGWDMRPWGGSEDPLHDNSMSTPEEFGTHLRAALKILRRPDGPKPRVGLICCWNEYGEGSYIEPTKKDGSKYLEEIKKALVSK